MRYRRERLLRAALAGALLMVVSTAAKVAYAGGNGLIGRPTKTCCSWAELFRQRRASDWTAEKIPSRDRAKKVAVLDKYDKLFAAYDQLAVSLQQSETVRGSVVANASSSNAVEWEPTNLVTRASQHWGQGKWGMNAMVSIRGVLENDRPIELWEKFYGMMRGELINRFVLFELEIPSELE